MSPHAHIAALFSPATVALVGASGHSGKIGNIILANLLRGGFKGDIFPVTPKGGSILGLPALRKLDELPEENRPLDLAVVCLPARQVPACIEELGSMGTRAAIVVGAGFREVGGQGALLETHVKKLAEEYGMALLGPNSLGLVNTHHHLNATFASGSYLAGDIGFFSQSGSLCVAVLDWARAQGLGFSSFVSLGNKAVLDESDILSYLADDPATKVILGYLESVENGPRFLRNAHLATRKKPVILLKAGRTGSGARAASSHTGALAGADLAYEAAFRQTGILRASRTDELFGMAQAFAAQPLPKGPGVAVVTNAGGAGIVATDACELAGLTVARLSAGTLEGLKEILPSYAAIYNPVDVISDASPECFAAAAELVLNDAAVHTLLVVASPTAHTPLAAIAERIAAIKNPLGTTFFACLMGGEGVEEARRIFTKAHIPCYPFPEQAVDALAAMYRQSRWKSSHLPVEVGYRHDIARARKVINEAREANLLELAEFQAQGLLRAYEIPMLESKLARTSDEAVKIANHLDCPVALKIASPQILHKTETGGVALHLDTSEKIRAAFLDITGKAMRLRKDAYIAGCLVQAMAPAHSREVIIGFRRDTRFGPLIIFGLGGIHVEGFKDISCRLAPLSLDDVHDMIREIKAFPILAGLRGEPPVKFTAIEDILLIMSQLALDFPDIQEAECNPVMVNAEGALVGDIRVVLARREPAD